MSHYRVSVPARANVCAPMKARKTPAVAERRKGWATGFHSLKAARQTIRCRSFAIRARFTHDIELCLHAVVPGERRSELGFTFPRDRTAISNGNSYKIEPKGETKF